MVRLHRGELDAATDCFRSVLEMDSEFAPALMGLGRAYLLRGNVREAIRVLEKAARLTRGNARYEASLAYAYAVAKRHAKARRMLARLEGGAAGRAYDIATVHAGLGDTAAALAWLDRAAQVKDPSLRSLLVDERLRSLQAQPRWRDVAVRLGLVKPGFNAASVG